MIQIRDLALTLGKHQIFEALSCSIGTHDKIGLFGFNGSGKSTLLKLISGYLKADSGTISISKGTRIGYLPQDLVLTSTKNVFDEAMDVFAQQLIYQQEAKMLEELFNQGKADDNLITRYVEIEAAIRSFDYPKAEQTCRATLVGLGFSAEQLLVPVTTLSTGWKMRLALAKLLLQDADFYLFDEPTNHLDMVSQEWFFTFLQAFRGGFLMATHDRHFLDRTCDHILELSRGKAQMYRGNFTSYVAQKEAQQEVLQAQRARQEREIAQKQATIDRFRASASKAGMARSMSKQLERIELVEVEQPAPHFTLKLTPTTRAGTVVLTLHQLGFGFDPHNPLFSHVNAQILRGQKVALIAPNGRGKTTLLQVIVGKLKQQQGTITFGNNVKVAYFEQDQAKALNPNNTILDEVTSKVTARDNEIRSMLGAFLFSGENVYKPIKALSGGERNRVAMAILLLQQANFLILDEPTNHLDLPSKEILLQALQQYDGTLLFVSHDHYFIEKLATRMFDLQQHQLFAYEGPYDEYLFFKKQLQPTLSQTNSSPQPVTPIKTNEQKTVTTPSNKDQRKRQQRIAKIEEKMAQLAEQLGTLSFNSPSYQETMRTLEALDGELKDILALQESNE